MENNKITIEKYIIENSHLRESLLEKEFALQEKDASLQKSAKLLQEKDASMQKSAKLLQERERVIAKCKWSSRPASRAVISGQAGP